MEQAFKLIAFIYGVFFLIYVGTIIWYRSTSNGSMPCLITQLGIFIVLFALTISKLVLEIFLNLPYRLTIFVLCLFAMWIAFQSFCIRKKRKIERSKKDNDKTKNDQ